MQIETTRAVNVAGARNPSVAVGGDGRVFVAFGVRDTIWCAVSMDRGRTFAAPVPVAKSGALSLGMRRGPRIVVSKETAIVSAVVGERGGGKDGDLRAWRSVDGARWDSGAVVNDVPGSAREGLHAMASAPDGTVACAWLDLRADGTRLFVSASRDGGRRWSENALAYRSPGGTICECCHPSLIADSRGDWWLMWRNVVSGARDMWIARSTDGARTFPEPRKLGRGEWRLNACPMDGGMIGVVDGAVQTVWRRDNEVFVSTPRDAERSLGFGQQPWVASTKSGSFYVWLQGRPGRLMALVPGAASPRKIAERADDPVVAPLSGTTALAAWSSATGIETVILRAG